MTRIAQTLFIFFGISLAVAHAAQAQPAPMDGTPPGMTAATAPQPSAAVPTPMRPAASPVEVLSAMLPTMAPASMPAAAAAPLPGPAMAASTAPPAKAAKPDIAKLVFTILGSIAALVFSILGSLGYLKWAKNQRLQSVLSLAPLAYDAVEGLMFRSPQSVGNKLLEFLRQLTTMLVASGKAELTPKESEAAAAYAAARAKAEHKPTE